MSATPEERSTEIIAEAEALVRKAQEGMERTQEIFREAGFDPASFDEAMAQLSAEDREFVSKATKELVARDLGLEEPASAAPRLKKPRSLI